MPRLCSGYDMGSNGSLHPCRFALEGRGHSAQARPCGKCIFCNDESMRAAVATPQGFGSVVRALKKWRVMSSPIYDLAFECNSLTSLPAAQLEALRGSAQDLVRKSNPNQPPQKTRRRKKRVVAQWKKLAWRRSKLGKLQRYTATAKRVHHAQRQEWTRIAKENPRLWFWADFRKNGGFYGDTYANAVLAEYTRLQNGDPFIEDAFLRSFHKFCPTCGKSFRGQGRGHCPTPDCRKILQVNRKRRKNLRKWLFKRVEGALSLGPPFEPALCGWAAREGYFDKFEAEVEPTNEEPATQEGTMDAEPAIQKPAAAIAQEVAEKIAMQEVIEETATAIAQEYAEESTAQEVSMDTKPVVEKPAFIAHEPAKQPPSQEVSMFEEPAIKEAAGDIAQELAKT